MEKQESQEKYEIIIPEHVKHLMDIERTPEQEKELEEALFGPCNMKYEDQFKYHSFLSVGQTINTPYKEWVGETVNDDIVVIRYKNGDLLIGTGRSEIKARNNVLLVGGTKNSKGEVGVYENLTLNKINKYLKLEWILPATYIED